MHDKNFILFTTPWSLPADRNNWKTILLEIKKHLKVFREAHSSQLVKHQPEERGLFVFGSASITTSRGISRRSITYPEAGRSNIRPLGDTETLSRLFAENIANGDPRYSPRLTYLDSDISPIPRNFQNSEILQRLSEGSERQLRLVITHRWCMTFGTSLDVRNPEFGLISISMRS